MGVLSPLSLGSRELSRESQLFSSLWYRERLALCASLPLARERAQEKRERKKKIIEYFVLLSLEREVVRRRVYCLLSLEALSRERAHP
jgi:hypothetical protein